jgi:hypothetical protein
MSAGIFVFMGNKNGINIVSVTGKIPTFVG